MPAIADGILVGDIDDSDEAFQKFGQLGQCLGLILNPRGIVYTTPMALEAAKQAMAAAKHACNRPQLANNADHQVQNKGSAHALQ
jgi:hypothetical protein